MHSSVILSLSREKSSTTMTKKKKGDHLREFSQPNRQEQMLEIGEKKRKKEKVVNTCKDI